MKTARWLLVVGTLVSALPASAEAPSSDSVSIVTDDQAVHEGTIIRENESGYLFRSADGRTYVIPYSKIVGVKRGAASASAPSAPAPHGDGALPPPKATDLTPARAEERQALQAKLATLREERAKSGGLWRPILSTVCGGTLVTLALTGYGMESTGERIPEGILGTLFLAGGTLGIISTVHTRLDYDRQIRETNQAIEQLGFRVTGVDLMASRDSVRLTVGGTF